MKKTLLAACVSVSVCLSTFSLKAATYYWDGGGNNGQWGDNVNWGQNNPLDPNWNVLPTAADTILFSVNSPAGNVVFTNDYSVNRIRLTSATVPRTLEIDPNELVDRTVTLAGGAAELLDQAATVAGRDLTFSGVPNVGGYRLKMQFGGTKPINVASTNSAMYISCDISGAGGFSKSGAGTLYLSGTNTYTGTTTVGAGTVLVNSPGSISASSAVTVSSGATLGGNGTINGAVTVSAGGRIAAGSSAGVLTLGGGADLSAGGTNVWELAANSTSNPGTDYDQISMTSGNLVLGGSATLSIQFTGTATAPDSNEPFWQSARSWTIIAMNGGANPGSSNFAAIENGTYAAGSFSTSVDGGGNVILTFTPSAPPVTVQVPIITSVVGAGTASVTINYTNTIAGTNYVVQYLTNLNSSTWTDLSPVPAAGTTSSTSDTPPAGDAERYYRVYYVNQ